MTSEPNFHDREKFFPYSAQILELDEHELQIFLLWLPKRSGFLLKELKGVGVYFVHTQENEELKGDAPRRVALPNSFSKRKGGRRVLGPALSTFCTEG